MATGFSPEEEDLYFDTIEAVGRRIATAGTAAELLAAVRGAYTGFERAYAAAPQSARAAVACCAGCDTCCHDDVAVQAHEVFVVAEYVQKKFPPAELEALIARSAEHRASYAARQGEPLQLTEKRPCPLLREGDCSVYVARPEICRAYLSRSFDDCVKNFMAGYVEIDVKVRGLSGGMFAIMLGMDQAIEAAGYDARAYDFGSALHEALTNSLCVVRWARKEAAFPDDCVER